MGCFSARACCTRNYFSRQQHLRQPGNLAVGIIPRNTSAISFSELLAVRVDDFRKRKRITPFAFLFAFCALALRSLWQQPLYWTSQYVNQSVVGTGVGALFTALDLSAQASFSNVSLTGSLGSIRLLSGWMGLAASVFKEHITSLRLLQLPAEMLEDVLGAGAYISTVRSVDQQVGLPM